MTLPSAYFDGVYAETDDPWAFRTRWYEQRKRALTLAALPGQRYRRCFEPGCSNGELTALLAGRCDEVLATDVSGVAVESARARVAGLDGVRVERGAIPADWPEGVFDLVVISELAYYLGDADLAEVDRRASSSLAAGGTLLACHWRHPVADYPRSGDDAQAQLGRGLHRVGGWGDDDLILTVWSNDPASVAARAGLDVAAT